MGQGLGFQVERDPAAHADGDATLILADLAAVTGDCQISSQQPLLLPQKPGQASAPNLLLSLQQHLNLHQSLSANCHAM